MRGNAPGLAFSAILTPTLKYEPAGGAKRKAGGPPG